mgnify:CR=1 FL=1
MGDICLACDGTGDRDFLSGAPCRECNGTGWRYEPDEDEFWDEQMDDDERGDE